MYDAPDQSQSPKKLHVHVIADYISKNFGVDDATAHARTMIDELFDARWEIISKQVMDAVLESGGVDPAILAKQYEGVSE